MYIKILLCLLFFCCFRSGAQTLYTAGRNKGSVSGTIVPFTPFTIVWVNVYDTAPPKKHWHSWAMNKELDENVKDSASKYWKIGMLYMDSARQAQEQKNMLHFRYYARKADEANIKSAKYVEKQ